MSDQEFIQPVVEEVNQSLLMQQHQTQVDDEPAIIDTVEEVKQEEVQQLVGDSEVEHHRLKRELAYLQKHTEDVSQSRTGGVDGQNIGNDVNSKKNALTKESFKAYV